MAAGTEAGAIEVGAAMAAGVIEAGGYRGWGLRSAYYGTYPYYGGGYAYSGGYADDYCPPYGYAGYYPGYRAWNYYGW